MKQVSLIKTVSQQGSTIVRHVVFATIRDKSFRLRCFAVVRFVDTRDVRRPSPEPTGRVRTSRVFARKMMELVFVVRGGR